MTLEGLEGTTYGPVSVRISPEKVSEFVTATGDDHTRWVTTAPPGFAAVLLFETAPLLIHSPEVGEHTRVLVHSDQRFVWHRSLDIGLDVVVTGVVSRVRVRGAMNFVTFDVAVTHGRDPVLDATSTFLMGSEPAATPGPDQGEPEVDAGSVSDIDHSPFDLGTEVRLGPVERGASRVDLVRYAAASRDFNPIHFDHDSARSAGLDGIVVHGLCMASWMMQLAVRGASQLHAIDNMKIRFRAPLRPGDPATLSGSCAGVEQDLASVNLTLARGETDLVTATAQVRVGE